MGRSRFKIILGRLGPERRANWQQQIEDNSGTSRSRGSRDWEGADLRKFWVGGAQSIEQIGNSSFQVILVRPGPEDLGNGKEQI